MSDDNAQSLLYAHNLKKSYGSVEALNGINLSLKMGECIALLGPNGAGKTTTCDILSGLQEADSGQLYIKNMQYNKNRKQILQNLGVQLQDTRLYGKFTVQETFELFASFYSTDVSVQSWLKRFDLISLKNSKIENLSGGQKQRVYLAIALIHNPDIILLDEPSNSLDPHTKHLVWDIIQDLKSQDRGILLCTHDMVEAQKLSDRVIIIDKGQLLAEGNSEQLIIDHCKKEIIGFKLDNKDSFNKLHKCLPWLDQHKHQSSSLYEIETSHGPSHIRDLTYHAEKLNISLQYLNLRTSNLEDVFLKITGRSIHNA